MRVDDAIDEIPCCLFKINVPYANYRAGHRQPESVVIVVVPDSYKKVLSISGLVKVGDFDRGWADYTFHPQAQRHDSFSNMHLMTLQ